ncbi:hypothetical protein EJB05_37560, partial [Eragrostis curvula]
MRVRANFSSNLLLLVVVVTVYQLQLTPEFAMFLQKEIIIRIQPESEKCRRRALKVAASVGDVESVSMTGRGKDLLMVVGDVDELALMKKLKDEVGEAELMELRTLPATDVVVTQSPYQQWPRHYYTPGRSAAVHGGGGAEYPVAAAGQAGYYYPRTTPSPLQHHHYVPSPVAGQQAGGYGYDGSSSYALAAARSHPTNYSPMIARHDVFAAPDGREHGAGGPSCCSIL